ncbi:MAG: thymidine kinase [Actinomycetes bacterium]|nr:MAG: thymidine kinase [Actinomycetota bacterium]
MAELVFFTGTMDCGKSTLALQTNHNHAARGRQGVIYTRFDRAGEARVSSRLGLEVPAREVRDDTDLWDDVTALRISGRNVDYIVCDEAQFYSPEQIEQLARLVDEMGIDVFAFGITADFRTRLFPGSARLLELADRVEVLQVQSLCWCGARATHNARTVDGVMVTEGEQVVVGDTSGEGVIAYEVLCRRHHMRKMTAAAARAAALSADVLPLGMTASDLEACAIPETMREKLLKASSQR